MLRLGWFHSISGPHDVRLCVDVYACACCVHGYNFYSGIHVCSWKEGQKVKWSICLHMYIHMRSDVYISRCVCMYTPYNVQDLPQ